MRNFDQAFLSAPACAGLISPGLTKLEYAAIHIAAGLAANSIPGSHHAPREIATTALDIAIEIFTAIERAEVQS